MIVVGAKYGRYTVLSLFKGEGGKGRMATCLCDCGTQKTVRADRLTRSATPSCGCFQREVCVTRAAAARTTHGQSNTALHKTWSCMKDRCLNQSNRRFAQYGGRVIKVFEGWVNNFQAFADYVGPRPPGMSLDRWPDKDGNYEPGNVRWATNKEQNRNRRNNKMVRAAGRTMTLVEACETLGISYSAASQALRKHGAYPNNGAAIVRTA